MVYIILIAYIALTFMSSLIGKSKEEDTPESYFLANRGLGVVTLFFTLIATNFSAFFFLGFAGEGYRIGYTYYAMMGFGTAFAALSFYLVGNKTWKLGKEKGYITPVEMIHDQSGSSLLKWVYLTVMILFTFPYLALQPMGAGYLLESLTNGEISYFLGASLLTIFIIIYVFIGGMKSVASTDVKQGIMMILLMFAAVVVIAWQLGGLSTANQQVFELRPELFSRAGGGGYFTPQKWLSLCLLWIACVPMFPQLFMRFFISKDLKGFKTTTVLYATIPMFLFLCPVIIGVLGHLSFPDLVGKEADQILPKMLMLHSPKWFYTLVMTGALAAFMSTLDSQLLALSTIATRDIYLPFNKKNTPSLKQQVWVGKVFVLVFAFIGLAIAYQPFDTIFDIAKIAFSGLAVLFPTTLAILYWKKSNPTICAISILLAEIIIVGVYFGWIPKAYTFGFATVLPAMLLSIFLIVIGSIISPRKSSPNESSS
jgi:SSS family solute:Na+ symporter